MVAGGRGCVYRLALAVAAALLLCTCGGGGRTSGLPTGNPPSNPPAPPPPPVVPPVVTPPPPPSLTAHASVRTFAVADPGSGLGAFDLAVRPGSPNTVAAAIGRTEDDARVGRRLEL